MEISNNNWQCEFNKLTQSRQNKILKVVSKRTDKLRLVIQDIHHPHNISACLRSAEAFGIQNVDIVNTHEKFQASTVAKGVTRWLTINEYNTITQCVDNLKEENYSIAAGVLHGKDSFTLEEIGSKNDKIALVFGNEHSGVSSEWESVVDYCFKIPMVGMVESLNISVSAAVSMFSVKEALLKKYPADSFYISKVQQDKLVKKWLSI